MKDMGENGCMGPKENPAVLNLSPRGVFSHDAGELYSEFLTFSQNGNAKNLFNWFC